MCGRELYSHIGKHLPISYYESQNLVLNYFKKQTKKLMSRRIGGENVKTQQDPGAVLYEASQKNLCRWLLKATKANTQFLAANIIMTCSLCSDGAICYPCIFSGAFQVMTHH